MVFVILCNSVLSCSGLVFVCSCLVGWLVFVGCFFQFYVSLQQFGVLCESVSVCNKWGFFAIVSLQQFAVPHYCDSLHTTFRVHECVNTLAYNYVVL